MCKCSPICLFIVLPLITVLLGYGFYQVFLEPPRIPTIWRIGYYGPGKETVDDPTIKAITINIPESDLNDFQKKLSGTKISPALENTNFTNGINTDYLSRFVEYWQTKYNWRKREAYLNQQGNFMTKIGGLNIHFVYVKPNPDEITGKKVYPLLMIHNWPGTVADLYKVIPMLTTPIPHADFVFELVIPSLPGQGFSEAPSKEGLDATMMALILHKLMLRLGHQNYYIHDEGTYIGQTLAIIFPNRILGFHSTRCLAATPKSVFLMLSTMFFPTFVVEDSKVQDYQKQFPYIFMDGGYYFLHLTSPDTIGVALTDSPIGLAAYFLERYAMWTNRRWRELPDGGLEVLSKDVILDNVMIYWFTKSITPSMRFVRETYWLFNFFLMGIYKKEVKVPAACTWYENVNNFVPKAVLEYSFTNLVQVTYKDGGGQFPAIEQPASLNYDIWNFVKLITMKTEF